MLRTFAKRLAPQGGQMGILSSVRGMADQSTAVAETLNWDDLQGLVHSPEAKGDVNRLHGMVITQDRMAEEAAKKQVTIDWAAWKSKLNPEMVSKYEATYAEIAKDSLEPTSDFDQASWNSSFDAVIAKAKQLEKDSEARIKVLEKELTEIHAEMKRVETVTVDEELAENPEMAKEIDEEISQQNYY
ncbi:hypothetical protein BSKO_12250 [Bryopsis sp. KO-2023]|nr:hypothetical protein BSKO_12250 [Bryopsis sp. KO-2023]